MYAVSSVCVSSSSSSGGEGDMYSPSIRDILSPFNFENSLLKCSIDNASASPFSLKNLFCCLFDFLDKSGLNINSFCLSRSCGEMFAAKRSCKSSWNSNSFTPFSLYLPLLSLLTLLGDGCSALDVAAFIVVSVAVADDDSSGIGGCDVVDVDVDGVDVDVEGIDGVDVDVDVEDVDVDVEGFDGADVDDVVVDDVVVDDDGSDGGVDPSPILAAYISADDDEGAPDILSDTILIEESGEICCDGALDTSIS